MLGHRLQQTVFRSNENRMTELDKEPHDKKHQTQLNTTTNMQ